MEQYEGDVLDAQPFLDTLSVGRECSDRFSLGNDDVLGEFVSLS